MLVVLLLTSIHGTVQHERERHVQAPPAMPLSGVGIMGVPLEQVISLDWHPALKAEWRAAAVRFPTVEGCATGPAKPIATARIDWYRIGTDVEADVCVTRVIARLGTVDGTVRWLKASGFRVTRLRRDRPYLHRKAPEQEADTIEAHWPLDQNGPLTRRGVLRPFLQWAMGHNVSCVISISRPSGLVSVNCTTNIL